MAAYGTGSTIYEVGALFGIHRNTVCHILERHDVQLRYHQTANVDLDRAAELSAGGINLTEVAAASGLLDLLSDLSRLFRCPCRPLPISAKDAHHIFSRVSAT